MNPLFLNFLIANKIREIRVHKIFEDTLGPVVVYEINRQRFTLVKVGDLLERDKQKIVQLTDGNSNYIILPGDVYTNKPEIENHPIKMLGVLDITKTDYYRGWRE